jgi:hypothetical protein
MRGKRELRLRTMCFATTESVLCVMLPLSGRSKTRTGQGSALITTLLPILPVNVDRDSLLRIA